MTSGPGPEQPLTSRDGDTTGRGGRGVFRRWEGSLFFRTILVTGVVIVLVGGLLTYLLTLRIQEQVLGEAARDVEILRPKVLRLIAPQELAQPLTGARYEEVDRMVRDYVAGPNVVRFKLWNASGTVVYSTLPSQVGESYLENEHLRQALGGRTVWEVGGPESPEERKLGELVEVYVPLAWEPGESPVGAMEVYLPYAPYARLLSTIQGSILLTVLLAALTLPAALYLLYRAGTASMQRERDLAVRRQREVASLNALLQQDLNHYFELRDRLSDLRAQLMQDPRLQGEGDPLPAREVWLLMEVQAIAEFAGSMKAGEG